MPEFSTITIVSATEKEVYLLKEQYAANSNIHFVVTGVGILHTTFVLTEYLQNNKPSFLLQVGIAGSFSTETVGSVVAVNTDIIADLGVYENEQWNDIFDLSLANSNAFPYQHKMLNNPFITKFSNLQIPVAKGITVNEISTNSQQIENFRQKYKADVESMEGAAFHFVALHHYIPFLQLRGISNKVGERNKAYWNFADSIQQVNHMATKVIEQLLH